MKPIYFVLYNGTTGSYTKLDAKTKAQLKIVEDMYQLLETVYIHCNYALVNSEKEAEDLLDKWMQ